VRARVAAGSAGLAISISITVRNVDASGSVPGPVALEVLDGDCPAGTVASGPSFAGGGSVVVLAPGASATAEAGLYVAASAFTTPGRRAFQRCRLLLRAIAVDATDPVMANNEAPLELSVQDGNDYAASAGPDVYLMSVGPVAVELPVGTTRLVRVRKPNIVFDAAPGTGSVEVTASADDGNCPPGTLGVVDLNADIPGAQDTVVLPAGGSVRGKVRVTVTASGFSTPTSPTRCTATIAVTYPGSGGDVSNDLTGFSVTVRDRNDSQSTAGSTAGQTGPGAR